MGPLTGFTVIEFAGIGPGPFAGMMLADMGAQVIRIERKAAGRRPLSLLGAQRRLAQPDDCRPEGATRRRARVGGAAATDHFRGHLPVLRLSARLKDQHSSGGAAGRFPFLWCGRASAHIMAMMPQWRRGVAACRCLPLCGRDGG